MCFSSHASIISFFVGIFSSLFLILFGAHKFDKENIVYGLLFIFITFMQLFDYMIWIDLKGTIGLNQFASIIAPIFNYSQPLFLYFLKNIFYPGIWTTSDTALFLLNSLYLVVFLYGLSSYYSNEKMLTSNKQNHLVWKWLNYLPTTFYLIIFTIDALYKGNLYYNLVFILLAQIAFMVSHKMFNYSQKEIWCVFVLVIPILLFLYSKIIEKY